MTAFPVEREASEHFLLLQSILCRYKPEEEKYVAVPLTTDHSPSVYAERMRIQKAGGNVRLALLCYLVFTSYLLYIMPISHVPQTHACACTANFFTTAS